MTESKDLTSRRRRKHTRKKPSWKLSAPQGGALVNVAPVFSADHRYLAVLSALELRLYAVHTRQCVARVPIDEAYFAVDLYVDASAELTSEGFPKVWIAKRNGICIFVDWKSEGPKSINLNGQGVQRIHKIIGLVDESRTFVLAVSDGVHDSDISIARVSADGSNPPSTLIQVNKANLLSLSHSKSHFIFRSLQSTKHSKKTGSGATEVLTVGKFVDSASFQTIVSTTIERGRSSSTVAISDGGIVAVGSVTGVIDLYYPVTDAESSNASQLEYRQSSKGYAIRTLKWHLDPVRALSFSLDGNYLLSGGNEKVLLFWQLDTGNIQFLPRLPGPITNIVVDNTSTTYAFSLGNNNEDMILLAATDLDARLRVSSINASYNDLPPLSLARANMSAKEQLTSASLKLLNLNKEAKRSRGIVSKILDGAEISLPNFTIFPSAIHSFTSQTPQQQASKQCLYWYFPTRTDAQIQIYDPLRGEQVAVQSVVRTLQLGKVLFEEAIPDPIITQLSLSADSQWMVTVDETTTQPIDDLLSKADVQINLKFWADDSASNEGAVGWKLVSQITSPHGPNVPVAAVAAAPQTYHRGQAFITACHGGGLRLWRPRFPRVQSRQIEWSARYAMDPSYESSITGQFLAFSAGAQQEQPDVSLAWASDASILLLGTGSDIYMIAVPTQRSGSFEVVRCLSGVVGSPIRGLGLIETDIIVLSECRLTVYDLLHDDVAWSANIGYTPKGSKALIAYGESSFAVAVNYASKTSSNLMLVSNVYVFSHKSPVPMHVVQHSRPIAAVHRVPSRSQQQFTFIDTDKMIYTLSGPDAAIATEHLKDVAVDYKTERVVEQEIAIDEEPGAGVSAILHPKSGKFTLPAKKNAETTAISEDSARANVVLNTSVIDTVFAGPEYALGDLNGVFDKLLGVIGQKE
ncbi:WD40-repeat-containing domain protein [Lipomyces chichibuensis]|uniref:WD40-repeat-containing domain protein n=1 Tax=Lipomyces chichibuensis TaxID=1546026 RepID=UPI003344240A